MEFAPILQRIISELEGVKGVALAGLDGLIVAEVRNAPEIDLASLVAEHTPMIRTAARVFEGVDSGECEEIGLYSDRTVLLSRRVSPDYFLLLVLGSEGSPGKGRYLLKREGEAVARAL